MTEPKLNQDSPQEGVPAHRREFQQAIHGALALLRERMPEMEADTRLPSKRMDPLPSLLDQCRELLSESKGDGTEPIRTVHHFACTGGSLITKCLTALPNTVVLSEVDPLSKLQSKPAKPEFAPTDIIKLLRYNRRGVEDDVVLSTFLGALDGLWTSLSKRGERLLIRDHPHSQYCTEQFDSGRRTVRDIIAQQFPVSSIVTVRNPLDSFLSLDTNGWIIFKPRTLDEYCRRYLAFLDDNAGVPIFRYEDFVTDPEGELQRMAAELGLPYEVDLIPSIRAIPMTGDSGRVGSFICQRSRRPVPERIKTALVSSSRYRTLCARLGYERDR